MQIENFKMVLFCLRKKTIHAPSYAYLRFSKEITALTPLLRSTASDIFCMWIAYDKFAKIVPKDTVDKFNKSKLTGNVNANKIVLP
jgi:hypothetical protein